MLARRMLETTPIRELRAEMDRLMEQFLGDESFLLDWETPTARRYPPVNLWEDDETLFAEAEIPGFTEDQIEISVAGNELTIKAERPQTEFEKTATIHRRERPHGSFSRTIRLPFEVRDDKITATLHEGLLTIEMPKAEACRARKIKVKALPS